MSARIRVLEEQLNRPLFFRSKAGTNPTPAGRQFHRFAVTLVQVWENAQRAVALPESAIRSSRSVPSQLMEPAVAALANCGCDASVPPRYKRLD